jgi:prepilin-type N-terminal cleavage/methylation domain-containing protein
LTGKLVQRVRNQDGYTLVEVVISAAIGAVLMAGLTSVVLTSVRATNIATARIEASSQIRSFQFFAYDDFAHSGIPPGSASCPCTQPIVLSGPPANSQDTPGSLEQVTYAWDGTGFLDRQSSTGTRRVSTNVTGFSWRVDGRTVVVSLTVTVQSYAQSQTLRFYPRVSP